MAGPETPRPGDTLAEIENRYQRYYDRLSVHHNKISSLRAGKPLPPGETLEDNYNLFHELNSKILGFYSLYPATAERLLRMWEHIDAQYQRELERKTTPSTRVSPESEKEKPPVSPESGKEIVSTYRNDFEEYLVGYGMPIEVLNKYDAESLEKMRSFVLTRSLKEVVDSVDWTVMKVRSIRELKVNLKYKTSTIIDILGSSSLEIKNPQERAHREKLQVDMIRDFNTIDLIFSTGSELKSPHGEMRRQQISDDVSSIYQGIVVNDMLNPSMFATAFAELPPLLDSDGNKEKISLGDAFFQSYKEIKRAGKKWVKDPKSGWLRPERVKADPLKPFKRNKAVFIEDDPHHTIQLTIENITKDLMDKSVAPEQEAGEYRGKKPSALNRLIALASKSDPNAYERLADTPVSELEDKSKHKRTTQGKAATLLSYHLALILMDLDEMDNVKNRPVGQNVLARAIHATSYSEKTLTAESQESRSNAYIVGRALSFVRPFGKFAAMDDGKTFEQAVLTSNSWKDLKIANWAVGMTEAWVNQIKMGLKVYEIADKGLQAGEIWKFSKYSLEEGHIISGDAKVVRDIRQMVRDAFEYHVKRDMSPSQMLANAEELEKSYNTYLEDGSLNPNFETRRPPSEEFAVITILTNNAKIDSKTGRFVPDEGLIRKGISAKKQEEMNVRRLITRFPKQYFMSPMRLGRWIDGSTHKGKKLLGHEQPWLSYPPEARDVVQKVPGLTPGSYLLEPTGQKEHELVFRLKEGVPIEDEKEGIDNTPKMLLKRLIVQYLIEMISLEGGAVATLKKSDWLPLGMFFSAEMRNKYRLGGYGTVGEQLLAEAEEGITKFFGDEHNPKWEIFRREDLGNIGDNIFTERMYMDLLELMGHRITAKEMQAAFKEIAKGSSKSSAH